MVILNPCWKNFVEKSTIKQVQKWSWDPRLWRFWKNDSPLTETNGGKRAFLHLKNPMKGLWIPPIVSPKMIPLQTNMAMEHHQIFKLHLQMFVFFKPVDYFHCFCFSIVMLGFSGGCRLPFRDTWFSIVMGQSFLYWMDIGGSVEGFDTVDGRNPAPADMANPPWFKGFYTFQVVQDSSINSINGYWWIY